MRRICCWQRRPSWSASLRDHALTHRATLRVGRTHGVHAEPDVWGHRVADFAFAMARVAATGSCRARDAVGVAKISGAVGTYSNIDPAVEQHVAAALGLRPADVATQVVIRDGISEWVAVAGRAGDGVRGDRPRGAARPADRGPRAGGAVRLGPEGLERDAAQAQPDPVRADLRARADRARRRSCR